MVDRVGNRSTHPMTGAAMTATDTITTNEVTDLDPARIEEFAGTILGVIANASTALTLSIGHRTGLFDTLAELPPSTSEEIATAARLQERYVREWLAAMLVGGIVDHAPDSGTWWLPGEHAAVLTRAAGKDNLARLAQFIGLMADVEHQVVACFRDGGGVGYDAFTEFHALMAEDSKEMAEGILIDEVVPIVDGLAQRLTSGISVADIGCGSGHHLNVLADRFPTSTFVGYDFEEAAVTEARAVAQSRGLTNVAFEVQDVVDLSGTGPFDLITAFDAIHDQAHPRDVLKSIADVLSPDGTFLMVDIKASSHPHENVDDPMAAFLYGVSLMHCMTVSLSQDGEGLGAAWGEQTAVRMLHEAGFANIDVKRLEGDFVNSYYVATLG
jgi:2-polyprenyl-3-methyl-5-hydroxy-6-metoxy-1,4-benzoquinol methylase